MNRPALLHPWSHKRLRGFFFAASGLLPLLLAVPPAAVGAETEIHRCVLEDGSVSFQETPCPEVVPAEGDEAPDISGNDDTGDNAGSDEFFDFVNPFDEPAAEEPEPEPVPPAPPELPSDDRVACEQSTREAIDEIEIRMRTGYSREEGQAYLADLLELTSQLRACKEL